MGSVVVSYLFGQLVLLAIPEDEIYDINFKHLMILVPLAVAYGNYHKKDVIILMSAYEVCIQEMRFSFFFHAK